MRKLRLGPLLAAACVFSWILLLPACGSGSSDSASEPTQPGDDGSNPTEEPPVDTGGETGEEEEPGEGTGEGTTPTPQPGAALAPTQPTSGPGGLDYRYGSVTTQVRGIGAQGYTLVYPNSTSGRSLPVVYLLHGYGSINLNPYRSWAEHLARHGAIVIYPSYQVSAVTPMRDYTPNAIVGIRAALDGLAAGSGPLPDSSRVVAIGHSMGGAIAANIAASAGSAGIPVPRALMAINPANISRSTGLVMPLEDMGQIPAGTLLLSLYSDRDDRIPNQLAKTLFYGATNVLVADKDYVLVHSDDYGSRSLLADHFAALAGQSNDYSAYPPDALDFYGYWKLADALMGAAFDGSASLRNVALGGGSVAQVDMGKWSDGRAVTPLTVTDAP